MKYDGYLLYTDVDQTLTGFDGNISKRNLEKIDCFRQNGGRFACATGRAQGYTDKFFLVQNAPVICLNGTMVYDKAEKKILCEIPVCNKHIEAIKYAENNFFGIEKIISFAKDGSYFWTGEKDYIKNMSDTVVYKDVFIFDDAKEALRFKTEMEIKYAGEYIFERSWAVGVEMQKVNSGKGFCVEYVKKLFKDMIHTVVCVGDYENDLTMIAAADIGIAVSNAIPAVKKAAKIIAPSCDDSAIAWIIDNIENLEKMKKQI